MSGVKFTKKIVAEVDNNTSPISMNTTSAAGDINRDGNIDYLVCARAGRMVWLENRGMDEEWEEHLIDDAVDCMECGGSLVDLIGNGYPDVIIGGDWRLDEIYWWENTGEPGKKWQKRLIARTGAGQFHDTLIGDFTGDGKRMLIFTNQQHEGGTTI